MRRAGRSRGKEGKGRRDRKAWEGRKGMESDGEGGKGERRMERDRKIQKKTGQEAGPKLQQIQCFSTCPVLKVPKDRTSTVKTIT